MSKRPKNLSQKFTRKKLFNQKKRTLVRINEMAFHSFVLIINGNNDLTADDWLRKTLISGRQKSSNHGFSFKVNIILKHKSGSD